MEIRTVAVFCSSSDAVAPEHFERAKKLGRIIGEQGWGLVFGGASVGLMGVLGHAAKETGSHVVGVVPEFLVKRGIAHDVCDEMIVTQTMAERKTTIGDRADAFVALPGSIGTLEELVEQMALKGLKQHTKPIVLVNPGGFWNTQLKMLNEMVEQHFLKPEMLTLLTIVDEVDDVVDAFANYVPPVIPNKWFSVEDQK